MVALRLCDEAMRLWGSMLTGSAPPDHAQGLQAIL